MTNTLTPENVSALRKPFPRESVGKLPKGGMQLDYVGHAVVTSRLLDIDPSWSWEPMATDEHGLPVLDRSGNLWIRLTVCGMTRIGVGDGKSAKELISDALRNAAMRFGVALDLWSKDELESTAEAKAKPQPRREQPPQPPAAAAKPVGPGPISPLQLTKLAILIKENQINRDEAMSFYLSITGRTLTSSKELTKAEASKVIDALTAQGLGADPVTGEVLDTEWPAVAGNGTTK